MKAFIPILFLIAACHSGTPDQAYYKQLLKEQEAQGDSFKKANPISPKPVQVLTEDTVYKIGSFLITAAKGMKYDIINKKYPPKTIASKGDTLYDSKDTLILGNFQELNREGIYKKYNSRFDFSMFKVSNIYKGKLAKPDFRSNPGAKYFRTMIRNGCEENGVNFAGHYTIVEWGCGAECLFMAVVDRINGRIYNAPFDTNDGHWGSKYTIDSRMIMVNYYLFSDSADFPGYYMYKDYQKPAVYLWNNSTFKKIE